MCHVKNQNKTLCPFTYITDLDPETKASSLHIITKCAEISHTSFVEPLPLPAYAENPLYIRATADQRSGHLRGGVDWR